jgi:aminopeptidase N
MSRNSYGTCLAVLLLALSACGSAPRRDAGMPIPAELPAGEAHGSFVSQADRTLVDLETVLAAAEAARVVYVGETHTNLDHHALQLEVVRALWERDPRLAIGMEMFFRPYQDPLDDYIAGRIDETEMLRRTEYFTRWGFPWSYYAPILRFARERGLRVVALNIPKEITRTVARQGLEALTPEQREEIPELDLGNQEHRAFLEEVFFGGHGRRPVNPEMAERMKARFENFYTAMCVWDDGMAESVVRALSAPGAEEHRMVVVVGAGHVRKRFGIPDRVERRTGWTQVVVVPEEVAAGATVDAAALLAEDLGDYVALTAPATGGVAPRLGVRLEPTEGGLKVTLVSPHGAAAKAGLETGDVIVSLGDRPVPDLVVLRLLLERLPRGRNARLVVRRGEEEITTAVYLGETGSPMRRMPAR